MIAYGISIACLSFWYDTNTRDYKFYIVLYTYSDSYLFCNERYMKKPIAILGDRNAPIIRLLTKPKYKSLLWKTIRSIVHIELWDGHKTKVLFFYK